MRRRSRASETAIRGDRGDRDARPAAAELQSRGRLILDQAELPSDPLAAREQLEALEAWLRERWACAVWPAERVELDITRQVIDELARRLAAAPSRPSGVRQDAPAPSAAQGRAAPPAADRSTPGAQPSEGAGESPSPAPRNRAGP